MTDETAVPAAPAVESETAVPDVPAVEDARAPDAAVADAPIPDAPILEAPLPSTTVATKPVAVSFRTSHVVAVLCAISLAMVLFHMQLSSRENANTGSRYATIESLVDYGTYNIDASRYIFTPDKVRARDHFVSSKPPLLPTYGAGVYWLIKKLTPYNILDNEGIVVFTVGVFTGWLGHLVFLIYFYRLTKLFLEKQLAIILTMAAACFAYLGVAYGTAINNHGPGAALAVMGFYYAYRARNRMGGTLDWILAGFWLGVLPAIDLSSAAVTGFSGLYLLTRDWKRTLLLYVPAAVPGIASQLLLSHAATGTWIPAYADASLMTYAGSYFGGRRSGIDALYEPKSVYAWNVLLGHHGLFSMTPIFFFSLYELVRRVVKRDRFFVEAAGFGATVFVVTAFYIVRTHNYGGWCVGMRWLVPVMPWLVLLFGFWLDRATFSRLKWALVLAAFAVSAFNVQDGLISPFQFSLWHNFLEDAPNRNRLGPPTLVLSRTTPAAPRRRPPRPRPHPVAPPQPPPIAPPPAAAPSAH